MRPVFININYNANAGTFSGWTATIGTARGISAGSDIKIAWGESILYPTKEASIATIQNRLERLDFNSDVVIFNNKTVTDYDDLMAKINAL